MKIYTEGVRYADGGGLNARGRARREAVRMQAADLLEQHIPVREIAHRLRVSAKSAYQWQQTWRRHGRQGLLSKGPSGSRCRLDQARLARLQAELDAGPAVQGWVEDQRWTLPRITVLIARLFHVRYTERGCRICCTGSAGPRRCRCTGPRSGMRRRLPCGGRRRGHGSDPGS